MDSKTMSEIQPRVYQKAYAFLVQIEGFKSQSFATCDGIDLWINSDTGGELKLTRGHVVDDQDFLHWSGGLKQAGADKFGFGRDVTVVLLDRQGCTTERYFLGRTSLTSYKLSKLDNCADENLMDLVTIRYRSIERRGLTDEEKRELPMRENAALDAQLDAAQMKLEAAEAALIAARIARESVFDQVASRRRQLAEKYDTNK